MACHLPYDGDAAYKGTASTQDMVNNSKDRRGNVATYRRYPLQLCTVIMGWHYCKHEFNTFDIPLPVGVSYVNL